MPKPYPDPTGINNTGAVIKYANDVVDGSLTILFTVGCAIILFMLLKQKLYRNSDSAAVASLLTLILSSFLWAMGLLAGKFMLAYLILTIVCTIWTIFDKSY